MIKNQKIEGTFNMWTVIFEIDGGIQSWLDCFSIGVCIFIQNVNFSNFIILCMLGSIWYKF